MPKRKFDKMRDDVAVEREKHWRKQRMRSKQEGKEEIEEGVWKWLEQQSTNLDHWQNA